MQEGRILHVLIYSKCTIWVYALYADEPPRETAGPFGLSNPWHQSQASWTHSLEAIACGKGIGGTKPHQFHPTTHLKNSSVGIAKPILSRSLGPSCSSSNRAESGRRHWRSGQCASAPFAPERQGIKGTSGAVMFGIQQVMIQRPSGSSFCVAGTLLKQIKFPTSSMNHRLQSLHTASCNPVRTLWAKGAQKPPSAASGCSCHTLELRMGCSSAAFLSWCCAQVFTLELHCQTIPKKTEGWTSFGKHVFILS